MKLTVLRRLRNQVLRQRRDLSRELRHESLDLTNLYRPRLRGRIEQCDAFVDQLDRLFKSHHDKWHDRRKR